MTIPASEAEKSGPFAMDLFGGSPRMATSALETSIGGTIVLASQSERETLSSGRATKLSSDQLTGMPPSSGVSLATAETDSKASNVRSSATKVRTSRRSLSDKLTLSLISAGLVCGITPSSTRKQSGQPIQVLALDTPAGSAAARPGKAS